PNPIVSLMPIVLIFIVFYFLLIRPQQKRQKEHATMLSQLKKGDQVMTNGGICGMISSVKETTVVIKVDDNVKIEFQKSAVSYIKNTDEHR
ncbi:MAG: preprotein translocase subunit YajC, partial [Candidatus Omnitrophota bacterium]|nr:preprotein translocase subunit YajC [Candidatus Omnitrophota bacterium]